MKKVKWRKIGPYVRVEIDVLLPPEEARALVKDCLDQGYAPFASDEGLPVTTENWLAYLAKTEPRRWMTLREIVVALQKLGWYSKARNPEKNVGKVLLARERNNSTWAWRKRTDNGTAVYWLGNLVFVPEELGKCERFYEPMQGTLPFTLLMGE